MDLSSRYMGLALKHPIVASASPLSMSLDGIRRLEEAGASAVVMYSLFEEQINQESLYLDHYLSYGTESYAEALSYFPEAAAYNVGPEGYMELIAQAKKATSMPIIGSLNGVSSGGWTEQARLMQQAGADALELNVYYLPTNPNLSGRDVEQMYLEVLRDVKKTVSIPVAVKLSPYFSSVANMAGQLTESRADALVLFNRFYQPDLDLEKLEVAPRLALSTSEELRLPLTWVGILYGRVPVDLAITTGIHTPQDVLKGMMAGAKVTMVASALLRNGLGWIGETLAGVTRWMEEKEYSSIRQMQGSMSQINVAEPAAFERANYMKTLQSFGKPG